MGLPSISSMQLDLLGYFTNDTSKETKPPFILSEGTVKFHFTNQRQSKIEVK